MATISIDNKEYDVELLSEEAKAQLVSINFVDAELSRLNALAAAMQTARVGYSNELKKLLESYGGDTIKFN